MLLGMFIYLITYIFYSKIAWAFLPFELWLPFTLSLPFIGLFSLWYAKIYQINHTELYFRRLLLTNDMCLKQLHRLRVEIVNEFENARKKYNDIHDIASEQVD